jgi:hypothetical protein
MRARLSSSSIASTAPNSPSIARLWPVPQPISRMRAPGGGLIAAPDQVGEDVAPRHGTTSGGHLVELRHLLFVDDALHQREHPLAVEREGHERASRTASGRSATRPGRAAAEQEPDPEAVESEADQRHDERSGRCAIRHCRARAMAAEAPPAVQDIAEAIATRKRGNCRAAGATEGHRAIQ